jgi:hypothetical protein
MATNKNTSENGSSKRPFSNMQSDSLTVAEVVILVASFATAIGLWLTFVPPMF